MGTQSRRNPAPCLKGCGWTMTPIRGKAQVFVCGEPFEVPATGFVCDACGFCDFYHTARSRIAGANAYRRKHGLLTSGEIGRLRRQAGGTGALAALLGVDNEQIDGWRMGDVQRLDMDLCMRGWINIIKHMRLPSTAEIMRSIFGDFCPGVLVEEDKFGFITLKRPT